MYGIKLYHNYCIGRTNPGRTGVDVALGSRPVRTVVSTGRRRRCLRTERTGLPAVKICRKHVINALLCRGK